jgi:CheY-like chemotaxis protein
MKPEHHITKPTILVVDDHPEQLSALFTELQLNGYSLLVSQNGAEAFKIFKRVQPDIILLDVRLPDMDGFEICRRLKQDEALCNIPVLFTTGITELDGKLEGFQAGGGRIISPNRFNWRRFLHGSEPT